jgi:hypothetical protein
LKFGRGPITNSKIPPDVISSWVIHARCSGFPFNGDRHAFPGDGFISKPELQRGVLSSQRTDEDYLGLISDLAESLRAMDNGPAIFNT